MAYIQTTYSGICDCKMIIQHSNYYNILPISNTAFTLNSGQVDSDIYALKLA